MKVKNDVKDFSQEHLNKLADDELRIRCMGEKEDIEKFEKMLEEMESDQAIRIGAFSKLMKIACSKKYLRKFMTIKIKEEEN